MIFWSCNPKLCCSSPAAGVSSRSTLRERGRAAAASVEFAVVAPAFFLFVLGMVEVGRGLMVQHLLLNAARQGCRAGILPSGSNTQISSAAAATLAPASITAQSVSVTVNGASADASTANSGDDVTVSVSVPVSSVTWVPVGSFLSGNLTAQYTLRKQ
jgi:Flp pilus assembly protein TadG